mgnify:CR=1 FL=1|tara:strand:+ start:27890 stop:28087 length:198 start_codon:yes stop_codon:yes gene_type:complete
MLFFIAFIAFSQVIAFVFAALLLNVMFLIMDRSETISDDPLKVKRFWSWNVLDDWRRADIGEATA